MTDMSPPNSPQSHDAATALRCAKCGSGDVATSFHPRRSYCNPHSRFTFASGDSEHLHRTCRCCGYDWTEETLDAS